MAEKKACNFCWLCGLMKWQSIYKVNPLMLLLGVYRLNRMLR